MAQPEIPPVSDDAPRRLPWLALLIAAAAVVVAGVLVVRIAAPLAGLIAPVEPPIFAPATLIEHRSEGRGVDEWLYGTDANGCAVYNWYKARATRCRAESLINCDAMPDDPFPDSDAVYNVGYCQGEEPFGQFMADWEIYIADGYTDGMGRTHFLIAREVDWVNDPGLRD